MIHDDELTLRFTPQAIREHVTFGRETDPDAKMIASLSDDALRLAASQAINRNDALWAVFDETMSDIVELARPTT